MKDQEKCKCGGKIKFDKTTRSKRCVQCKKEVFER